MSKGKPVKYKGSNYGSGADVMKGVNRADKSTAKKLAKTRRFSPVATGPSATNDRHRAQR